MLRIGFFTEHMTEIADVCMFACHQNEITDVRVYARRINVMLCLVV